MVTQKRFSYKLKNILICVKHNKDMYTGLCSMKFEKLTQTCEFKVQHLVSIVVL